MLKFKDFKLGIVNYIIAAYANRLKIAFKHLKIYIRTKHITCLKKSSPKLKTTLKALKILIIASDGGNIVAEKFALSCKMCFFVLASFFVVHVVCLVVITGARYVRISKLRNFVIDSSVDISKL